MCIRLVPILFFLALPLYVVYSQPEDNEDIFTYHRNIFLSVVFPKGIAEGVALRSYLRSSSWDTTRQLLTGREELDELYLDANDLCCGNQTAAILACAIAVLDHKTIPLQFLFGIVLPIPLTIESQKDFDARVSKLPAHIYDPKISDTDKLQHFFFSAFLERTVQMNWLVRLLGNAVEIGEDLFVSGGKNDPRDRHANNDGRAFGAAYNEDVLPLPSAYLTPNP